MPSPPPPYNFAVIPPVRSPYPNWDRDDRRRGRRPAEHGELVLDTGHETPASTVRDARLEEVLEMPSESPWPLVLAALRARLAFVMLLVEPLRDRRRSSSALSARSRLAAGTRRSRTA